MPDNASRTLNTDWGEFLSSFVWTYFVTLTTRSASSADSLLRSFRRYERSLQRIAQQRVGYFVAIERTTVGHVHAHALFDGPSGLEDHLAKRWLAGRTQVLKYDPARGAAYYVTKYMSDDCQLLDYDLSPRLRRRCESKAVASGIRTYGRCSLANHFVQD